jgi:hypothetical protein
MKMKSIIRRLNRLESVTASIDRGGSIAEEIQEQRRRRLEANGLPAESRPPIDYTGCRTIADHILRGRQACMKRQLPRMVAPNG